VLRSWTDRCSDGALPPPRHLAPALRHCLSRVTPGSDGGGGRDRDYDELPGRLLERRQQKQPLPVLHRLDTYSHFIVRSQRMLLFLLAEHETKQRVVVVVVVVVVLLTSNEMKQLYVSR